MFDFETPYLDMYKTQHFKLRRKPTALHQQTCPVCDRKLVNIYYSDQVEKYICKMCSDKLMLDQDASVVFDKPKNMMEDEEHEEDESKV